jgi:hypothetical protein
VKNKKHIRLALQIDLMLQRIPLLAIIISLIGAIFEKSALILALFALPVLGIVQVISVLCFALWLNDKVRIKYLISCFAYGILIILVKFFFKGDPGSMVAVLIVLPILMAVFYYWYSWSFYRINKDMLYDMAK